MMTNCQINNIKKKYDLIFLRNKKIVSIFYKFILSIANVVLLKNLFEYNL